MPRLVRSLAMKHGFREMVDSGTLLLVFGTLAIVLTLVGIRKVFLGYDSIGNYAHTWYISEELFTKHVIPLKMNLLDGGKGLALPYGAFPWTVGAVLYHFLLSRAVTIMMVLGVLSAMFAVRLERFGANISLLAIYVASPAFLHEGILSFQMPFFWAVAFVFLYFYFFSKGSYILAFASMILAFYTHPFLAPPAVFTYNAFALFDKPERRKQILILTALSIAAMLPMAIYIHGSPLVLSQSFWYLLARWAERLSRGEALIILPFVLVRFKGFFMKHSSPVIIIMLVGNLALLFGTHNYYGLFHDSNRQWYEQYLDSKTFVPGATYRILTPATDKDAMLYFIQHDGVLANDFFTESMHNQNWEAPEYSDFLREKQVDFVVLESNYDQSQELNEGVLLANLADGGKIDVRYQDKDGRFTVYDVRDMKSEDGS